MASIIYNNIPFPENALTDQNSNFILGQFMTAWSQVESLCGFLFRELSEIDPNKATIIFDRIGTREQTDIVKELLETSDDLSEHAALLDRAQTISVARNKIVHAGWGLIDGEPARFWHGITSKNFEDIVGETPKGLSARQRFIFSLGEISALTTECTSLRDDLQNALHQAFQKKRERGHVRRGPDLDGLLAQFRQRSEKH